MIYGVRTRIEMLTEWLIELKRAIKNFKEKNQPVPQDLTDLAEKVENELKNYCFKGDFNIHALIHSGVKLKLKSWEGYWAYDKEKETIMMHCKDGAIVDIRETNDIEFTISNILASDWEIATIFNCPVLFKEEGIELQ